MCRIAGMVLNDSRAVESRAAAAWEQLWPVMRHGGPDGQGIATLGKTAFFHTRLALLDRSAHGAQPMRRENYLLNYNGEVYTHNGLRKNLAREGHRFAGHSDTETVMVALMNDGAAALPSFKGMFALAFWDADRETLLLARDPLGIKPLYYSHTSQGLIFASELKALTRLPGHDTSINKSALPTYLQRGYIPAPATIYQNTCKLGAGEWLSYSPRTGALLTETFYQLPRPSVATTRADSLTTYRNLLEQSCQRRLLADVPVGVLLSGGIDSSLIAATVSRMTGQETRTYTMGFSDPAYDESERAAAIASALGTRHTTFTCNPSDFLSVLPRLADVYDEPFGDSSGIATFLLSRKVGSEINCCLSGEGGDELMGGYAKYRATLLFYRYLRKIPNAMRRASAGLANLAGPAVVADWLRSSEKASPTLEERIYKFTNGLRAKNATDFFDRASSYTGPEVLAALGLAQPSALLSSWTDGTLLQQMAATDLRYFTADDLLVKTDRASMQHALEMRLPFLDTDLIEFALALPAENKISGRRSKILSRQLLAESLPGNLIDGPKRGFAIPLDHWLKTVLRQELKTMANNQAFSERFGFTDGSVAKLVGNYLEGRLYVNAYPIWFLFVLFLWHQRWPA